MLETEFASHLMPKLCAPHRGTRFERQQSGLLEVIDRKRKRTHFVHCAASGSADYVGRARGGCIIELELKGPKTAIRKAQRAREKHFAEWGCVYVRYRYSTKLTLEENIAACIEAVDTAVVAWRRRILEIAKALHHE